MSTIPTENPPAYSQAVGNGQTTSQPQEQAGSQPTRNPTEHDLDEDTRILPPGWIVQLDTETERYFFVDTRATPPRSIWVHPQSDEEWLQQVPNDTSPDEYAHELWAQEPDSANPQAQSSGPRVADQLRQDYRNQHGNDGPLTEPMQGQQSAPAQQDGKRVIKTRQELVEYILSKMGTPEEYEAKHPPNKASKLFRRNESPAERQRRHAENKARDILDQAAMQRSMTYSRPGMAYSGYGGYPAYGRRPMYGYGGYGGMYGNRMGMGGGFMPLGLGMGAGLLGGSMLGAGLGGFGGGFGGGDMGGGGDGGGGGM